VYEDRKLPNGTVLKEASSYLDGLGILKITNGTADDSVVKLVTSKTGRLVYFAYIAANSEFTINNISDGNYRLLFSSGKDWDGSMFTREQGYSSFGDAFDFITTKYSDEEYEHTKYSTFEVTLNPVIGGTATTNKIDPNTFGAYQ
jgi:hypothetical protein